MFRLVKFRPLKLRFGSKNKKAHKVMVTILNQQYNNTLIFKVSVLRLGGVLFCKKRIDFNNNLLKKEQTVLYWAPKLVLVENIILGPDTRNIDWNSATHLNQSFHMARPTKQMVLKKNCLKFFFYIIMKFKINLKLRT